MSTDAIKVLKRDPVLRKAIKAVGPIVLQKREDLYIALLRSIVGQQLSVKAAQTIWQRFLDIYGSISPTPEQVLVTPLEHLRKAGLSGQKAVYLQNIARFAIEQGLDYRKLKKKTDEELVEYLTAIKGVGRWTVEMILMFNLQRKDVFPVDDLGIQNGIKLLYRIRTNGKKQLYRKMNALAEAWQPYRTLACMYIWRFRDEHLKNTKAR